MCPDFLLGWVGILCLDEGLSAPRFHECRSAGVVLTGILLLPYLIKRICHSLIPGDLRVVASVSANHPGDQIK